LAAVDEVERATVCMICELLSTTLIGPFINPLSPFMGNIPSHIPTVLIAYFGSSREFERKHQGE
jgi:hypothetical protein